MSQIFVCKKDHCGRKFKSEAELEKHITRRHDGNKMNTTLTTNTSQNFGDVTINQSSLNEPVIDNDDNNEQESNNDYNDMDKLDMSEYDTENIEQSLQEISDMNKEQSDMIKAEKNSYNNQQQNIITDNEQLNSEYMGCLLRLGRENQSNNEFNPSTTDIQNSRKQLTANFIKEKSNCENIETIETQDLSNLKQAAFDETNDFKPSNLYLLNKLIISKNCLTSLGGILQCTNIIELDISENRLRNLICINNLYKQKNLIANDNMVENQEPLSNIKTLKYVQISNNKIKNMNETIIHLKNLPQLKELNLKSNPCTRLFNYRYDILTQQTDLKKLDGEKIQEADFELAKNYKKIMWDVEEQLQENQSCFIERPGTAPNGGVRGLKSLTGQKEGRFANKLRNLNKNSNMEMMNQTAGPNGFGIGRSGGFGGGYKPGTVIIEEGLAEQYAELKEQNELYKQEIENQKKDLSKYEQENADLKLNLEGCDMERRILEAENKNMTIIMDENKTIKEKLARYEESEKMKAMENDIENIDESIIQPMNNKQALDQISSLNFRVNEYLDEIIKMRAQLEQRGGKRKSVQFADEFDQENQQQQENNDSLVMSENYDIPKTDDELLHDKIEDNQKGKVTHVKINQRDNRRKNSVNSVNSFQSVNDSMMSRDSNQSSTQKTIFLNNNSSKKISLKPPKYKLASGAKLNMGGNGSVQGENTSKLSESMANDVTSKLTDGQDFDDIMDAELEKFMKDNLSKLNEARNMLKYF